MNPRPERLAAAVALAGALAVAAAARAGGCPAGGAVERDGWSLSYDVSPTDGLRITNAAFRGATVLTMAKLAEWHSDSGMSGFVFSTGCESGGGFAIYPYGEVQVLDLAGSADGIAGFEVVADFRMANWGQDCNLRFEQRAQFYESGVFRIAAGAFGRDCSSGSSTSRPLVRIDLAAGGTAQNDHFELWDGSAWAAETTELLRTPGAGTNGPLAFDPRGSAARILDGTSGNGFFLVPGDGDTSLPGPADEPFFYTTLHDAAEGDADLGAALGSCCNDDEAQGPEAFVDGESIAGADLVLWYVPQLPTDAELPRYGCWTVSGPPTPETYPCYAGPFFVPTPGIFDDDFETGDEGRWSASTG